MKGDEAQEAQKLLSMMASTANPVTAQNPNFMPTPFQPNLNFQPGAIQQYPQFNQNSVLPIVPPNFNTQSQVPVAAFSPNTETRSDQNVADQMSQLLFQLQVKIIIIFCA